MRGLKRHRSARTLAAGHAFVQNLRRGHYAMATDAPGYRPMQHCRPGLAMPLPVWSAHPMDSASNAGSCFASRVTSLPASPAATAPGRHSRSTAQTPARGLASGRAGSLVASR